MKKNCDVMQFLFLIIIINVDFYLFSLFFSGDDGDNY